MNIFKRAYCRIFQFVFKVAIPLLPYRQPKILKDYDSLVNLFKEKKLSKILIVTDNGLFSLGLLNDLEKTLKLNNVEYVVYKDTVANPTTDNVDCASNIYRENNCQAIIAFGGGSSLDCAKAVGAVIVRPSKSLNQMKGLLKVRKKLPTLIAIPTTAGTGSETTLACVITDSKTRHKYVINDFNLIPHYCILDAELTVNLPKFITVTTGLDALTHAVEAYIGKSTTISTRKYSILATKLIFENLLEVYNNPQNLVARENMLKASFYAGLAFTKSYVGYVHAIAHSLGGKYNVPHGLANAIILPKMLKCYGKSVYKKLFNLALVVGLIDKGVSIENGAKIFIDKILELNRLMNIPDKIVELKKEDIELLSTYADKEANPLYPVPKLFDRQELANFYSQLI